MILMSHHYQYDTPKDEARVTTTTLTAPAQAAVTPPDGMRLLPSDFNPGNGDVSKRKMRGSIRGNVAGKEVICPPWILGMFATLAWAWDMIG